MIEDDVIDELLSIWHERFDRGEFVSAVALCADRPELIPELERRIEPLKAMATLARSLADGRGEPKETGVPNSTSPASVQVPGYELIARLGEGGMGTVYRARDERLKRLVALKVLHGGLAAARHFDRFRVEAEAIARVQHPHIVQVFAIGELVIPGEASTLPYLALEYVNGESLDKVFASGRIKPGEAARLVRILAHAVHAAHVAGVIHRDLKPANVLLAPAVAGNSGSFSFGFPKVADFGLARLLDTDQRQTLTGTVMGTPAYMAPEQAEGRSDIGPAADVWALGVVFYEALTGNVPFKGDSVLTTLDMIRRRPPQPPREVCGDVPVGLEVICLRCLEKDPTARYLTAAALAEELDHFSGSSDKIRSEAPICAIKRRQRHKVSSKLIILIAWLAGGIVMVISIYNIYINNLNIFIHNEKQNHTTVATQVVYLNCLGTGGGDGPRFLDGRPPDGTVGLAPATTGGFTGTRWLIVPANINVHGLMLPRTSPGRTTQSFDAFDIDLLQM